MPWPENREALVIADRVLLSKSLAPAVVSDSTCLRCIRGVPCSGSAQPGFAEPTNRSPAPGLAWAAEHGLASGHAAGRRVRLPAHHAASHPARARCYAWGQALRAILDARPERVALMASGGLSHFPGTDQYGSPDYDWDRQMLDRLVAGRGAETVALTGEELDKAGNVEFRTWITLLGAVGPARARVICYEPSWHHGNATVTWPVA